LQSGPPTAAGTKPLVPESALLDTCRRESLEAGVTIYCSDILEDGVVRLASASSFFSLGFSSSSAS
jgi:hypothetical protein